MRVAVLVDDGTFLENLSKEANFAAMESKLASIRSILQLLIAILVFEMQ